MNMNDLRISNVTITVNGATYVVTTDTGERSYGDGGGDCAFAYDAADVSALAQPATYSDMCETITAVDASDPNWEALSVALALRGMRLTEPGACRPALNDREYRLIQLATRAG